MGRKQAERFLKYGQSISRRDTDITKLRFGDNISEASEILEITIPHQKGVLVVDALIVQPDVPLPVGLDTMERTGLSVNTALAIAECGECTLQLTKKRGHLQYEWDSFKEQKSVFFTKTELKKLHRNFLHPSANKLFELIQRAKPTKATSDLRKRLDDLSTSCNTCETLRNKPKRFMVSLPYTG